MSNNNIGESPTNTTENSCKEIKIGCVPFWEQCQDEAILQLTYKLPSEITNTKLSEYRLPGLGIKIDLDRYFLIKDYEQRARIIASVYARLYLEEMSPDYGNSNLKGRFHWMGLGAFASKTVAYVLNHWLTDFTKNIGSSFKEAREMFACGNFWLYMEIAPWHIAWAICSESFDLCKTERDSRKFSIIQEKMKTLDWAEEALPKIGFLALDNESSASEKSKTGTIEAAFDALTKVEAIFESSEDEQEKYEKAGDDLLKNLMSFADNEQRNILQPIVWENESVKTVAEMQRWDFTGKIAPSTAVALSSDYHYSSLEEVRKYNSQIGFYTRKEMDERYRDIVPELPVKPYLFDEGAKAEDEDSRMEYVTRIAEAYHDLMLHDKGRAFLHEEIAIIATWGKG